MNTMKALVWKDFRINRTVIITAASILLFPYVVGGGMSAIAEQRWGAQVWWGESIMMFGLMSLMLSLVSVCLLSGNAFAGERSDRTAEFFAYLPPSAGQRLASKLAVALGAVLIVWLINAVVIYGVAPHFAMRSQDMGGDGGRDVLEQIPHLVGISIALFGAAWLASAMLSSHVAAAGCGVMLPIFVACAVKLFEYWFDWKDFDAWEWVSVWCAACGLVCFIAGTVYYLRRVEP